MKAESRRALSLQALARHQERVRGMVQKIQQYKPTFDRNHHYKRYDVTKRAEERERQSDRLFEENMKLIYRIETTGPKIETKKFPQIKPNPRRLKSLSVTHSRSTSSVKPLTKDAFHDKEAVQEENMKMIVRIECTGPKIQCWTTKKARMLNELIRVRKREQERKILEKFKDISKELARIGKQGVTSRNASSASLTSRSPTG